MQSKGIKVIPSLSWGEPDTFLFAFDGIPKGSIVAVSTIGVRKEKDLFMQGYNYMLMKIKPDAIICYGKPFNEMKGNVITVDYSTTNNLAPKKNATTEKSNSHTGYIKKTSGYILSGKGSGGGVAGTPNFPGWDPTVSPEKGYEWRGKGDPKSGKGSWYNPKTKEMLHPDLEHPEPFGPHWDYNYPGGGNGFRIYPDGSMIPKCYGGEIFYD